MISSRRTINHSAKEVFDYFRRLLDYISFLTSDERKLDLDEAGEVILYMLILFYIKGCFLHTSSQKKKSSLYMSSKYIYL